MNAKSFIVGFLTGTVIAGAATMLNAPTSGKELRTKIKDNKDEILATLAEVKERLIDIKDETAQASKVSKDSINSFIADVKILIENWKQDIEPNKQELTSHIQEIESSISELENTATASPILKQTN
ncbi:YtxH domain-containing protein [Peribacillus glennii]|uniref:YtxH domain-containing protein n=1 Tax=Peribacillus glennii TaxID=2303991 RepID=A0A372L9V8_9BACI|nr:YtxH domain-containing protein [Peribacillus glennii]RFU62116.1 YtxH domain-containing protein [Peribacillus glennii]